MRNHRSSPPSPSSTSIHRESSHNVYIMYEGDFGIVDQSNDDFRWKFALNGNSNVDKASYQIFTDPVHFRTLVSISRYQFKSLCSNCLARIHSLVAYITLSYSQCSNIYHSDDFHHCQVEFLSSLSSIPPLFQSRAEGIVVQSVDSLVHLNHLQLSCVLEGSITSQKVPISNLLSSHLTYYWIDPIRLAFSTYNLAIAIHNVTINKT